MSETRHKWFSMLASLTYPVDPGQAAAAFKPYLTLLADLPDAAFTRASLEAVCEAPHKMAMRSYGEISGPLRAWWRDNRPFVPALPAPIIPNRVPPTQAQLDIVAHLTREAVRALQPSAQPEGEKPPVKARYLSDGHLLAVWEKMAADGSPCALARVTALRNRMEQRV